MTLAEENKGTKTGQQTQGKATKKESLVFQRHWSTFTEHPFDINYGNQAPRCIFILAGLSLPPRFCPFAQLGCALEIILLT